MLLLKSNRFNINAILKLVILLGFAIFFFTSIQTGKVQLFIHPRIVQYLKFGIVAMLLISLFILGDVFKPQRKKINILPYLFFIIPLIFAFTVPAKAITSNSMSFGNMKIAGQTTVQNDTSSIDNTDISEDSLDNVVNDSSSADNDLTYNTISSSNNHNADASLTDGNESVDNGLKLQGDTVVMDENNFVGWIQEISTSPEKYYEKKIQVTGFVFKDKQFKANEFVPARLMMACCAADLQPVGLLCRYDKASEFKNDSWVRLSGTIKQGTFQGQKTPIIVAESVGNSTKPANEYVYPY
jgi:putative membrane protein